MDDQFDQSNFPEERKRLIVEYVTENKKATVPELCSKFQVSSATIRNDLREMADSGLLRRTHGGAISNASVNFELDFKQKAVTRIEAKRAITLAAVKYINEGDSIALDAGTTSFELAKLLTKFSDLTVVTYDLNIASYLDQYSHLNIIMAGGTVRKGFHYIAGDMAINTIKDLNYDICFISANGVHVNKGLSTPKIETGSIKQIMMDNAQKVILITDSTKLNNISFSKFADLSKVDHFITDSDADPIYLDEFRKKEIFIEVVEY